PANARRLVERLVTARLHPDVDERIHLRDATLEDVHVSEWSANRYSQLVGKILRQRSATGSARYQFNSLSMESLVLQVHAQFATALTGARRRVVAPVSQNSQHVVLPKLADR